MPKYNTCVGRLREYSLGLVCGLTCGHFCTNFQLLTTVSCVSVYYDTCTCHYILVSGLV